MTAKNDILRNVDLITSIEKKVNNTLLNTLKKEKGNNVSYRIVWKRHMMN